MHLDQFHIVSISHRNTDLDTLGQFHLEENVQIDRCQFAKDALGLEELMMLSTCNRVEFYFTASFPLSGVLRKFLESLYPGQQQEVLQKALNQLQIFSGNAALNHLLRVSSSLESLVIGEREIITQVRNAYERFNAGGLTGDFLRIATRKAVETAKSVYTRTEISNKPVSVVNLAFRQLKEKGIHPDSRILVVGAGQTNAAMIRNLGKAGLTNVTIFNRTASKAEALAKTIGGRGFALTALANFKDGFDILITCTGSSEAVISKDLYNSLVQSDPAKKTIVDLAMPQDTQQEIVEHNNVDWIGIKALQEVAATNLNIRKTELVHCEAIIEDSLLEFDQVFRARQVELAMKQVPNKVREIRETAVNEVFAKELNKFDENSMEVVDKLLSYLEKKYISVPMKMAREILLEKASGSR